MRRSPPAIEPLGSTSARDVAAVALISDNHALWARAFSVCEFVTPSRSDPQGSFPKWPSRQTFIS